MAGSKLLHKWFPHTTAPFIASAPMFLTSSVSLALAVTQAGGFGFLGAGFDCNPSSALMQALEKQLAKARQSLNLNEGEPLPIGIGFLTFHSSAREIADGLMPLLRKNKPLCVWLFAPAESTVHASIISTLKPLDKEWGLKVFVQVGTVAAAREAAQQGCDGISAQGVDAGGHQWAQGAGIVSLVPEIRNLLECEFPEKQIALLAAGGICDGSGVAAALALGADGVAMGTRFACTKEALGTEQTKQALVNTQDGGATTLKSCIFDDVIFDFMGLPDVRFPRLYDGRAVKAEWFRNDPDEARKEFKAVQEKSENTVVWAGTAVGLVRSVVGAGEVVKTAQNEAKRIVRRLGAYLETQA